MDDIIEILSDRSSSTSPTTVDNIPKEPINTASSQSKDDIEAIILKYTKRDVPKQNYYNCDLDTDDEDVQIVSSYKKADKNIGYLGGSIGSIIEKYSKACTEQNSHENVFDKNLPSSSKANDLGILSNTGIDLNKFNEDMSRCKMQESTVTLKEQDAVSKKRKQNPDHKSNKKMLKTDKDEKAVAARLKLMKQAMLKANKNIKPEECIKFIKVGVDPEILNEPYGGQIITSMQNMNITYKIETQLVPHTITWSRSQDTHFVDDNGQLAISSGSIDEDAVLLMMNWQSVVEHVNKKTLLSYIQSIRSINPKKKLSLGIYGIQEYFKSQKNQKRKEMRSKVTGSSMANKSSKICSDLPRVSQREVEYALTELQLRLRCSYRFINTPIEAGEMIAQFSKAIAQAPYKLQKQEQQRLTDWYMSGDNRDCVAVDKNGNGLQRLWQQHITMFPLARLETAEAVTTKYQTPLQLIEAYDKCLSSKEGEALLQDLPIRRAAGPLTTQRKMGPELSKKLYRFYTSCDGDVVI